MMKLPPIEKIPEAYSAIVDERVNMYEDHAIVTSSNKEKEYLIQWRDHTYYSNDNSTYWQSYPGYPVLAVLMLQGKLSYDENVAMYFKNVNWNQLNKDNKRDYHASLEQILKDVSVEDRKQIDEEISKVFEAIKSLDIALTKKKF